MVAGRAWWSLQPSRPSDPSSSGNTEAARGYAEHSGGVITALAQRPGLSTETPRQREDSCTPWPEWHALGRVQRLRSWRRGQELFVTRKRQLGRRRAAAAGAVEDRMAEAAVAHGGGGGGWHGGGRPHGNPELLH